MRPLLTVAYCLFVALGGLVPLAVGLSEGPQKLPWPAIAMFSLLSLVVQRSSFHLGTATSHSLVGLIDLAAVLTLGPLPGAVVATASGIAYLELNALRHRRHNRYSLVLVPLFNGGLKAGASLLSGALLRALGAPLPLAAAQAAGTPLSSSGAAAQLLAVCLVSLVWFALDHAGWGILDALDGGAERLRRFIRQAFPQALLVELAPLPLSLVVAWTYARLGPVPFGLAALAVVGTAVLAQVWARNRSELTQRVAELATIEQIGRTMAEAQLDVDGLCELLYQHASQVADTTMFHLGLFHNEEYAIKLWMREGQRVPNRSFQLAPGTGLVSWLRETGQPILVGDFLKEGDSLPARPVYVSERPPRSALFVPLMAGQTVIGTLSIQSYQPNAYGPGDLRMLSAMANQAAVAIQRARLYEAERQQAWLSTALLQVAEATGRLSDMAAVLTTIVRLTPLLAGVDRCAILLWDEDSQTFYPAQAHGLSPELRSLFESLSFPAGTVAALDLIRDEYQPLIVDLAQNGDLIPEWWSRAFDIRQMVILPLLAQGELLGVLLVDYTSGVGASTDSLDGAPGGRGKAPGRAGGTAEASRPVFSERVVEMLTGIANQAAMVLQSARLLQSQQEEAYVSMALLQVAEAISGSTIPAGHNGAERAGRSLDDSLAAIARITPMLVGVESCAFYLRDRSSGDYVPVHQYGLKEGEDAFWTMRIGGDSPLAESLWSMSKEVLRLDDLPDALRGRWPGVSQGPAGVSAPPATGSQLVDPLLVLPMVARGAPVGIMSVVLQPQGPASKRRASQRWISVLTGIASQAAIAVETDRLLEEAAVQERMRQELSVARRIQSSFLPERCPAIPGWELAAVWRSAREVAGDFYDFIPLPEGRLGVVIADVADKGVPAALYMALSRTLVRTMAMAGRPPAEAIAMANNLILADARAELFVTLFYAILEPGSGRISYVNAGHLPPILVRSRDGTSEELRTHGMAMGVLADTEYTECTADLQPGDTLILYTDGASEASTTGFEMFGRARLAEEARSHQGRSATELVALLDGAISEFVSGAPPSDDLTLVIARRTADTEADSASSVDRQTPSVAARPGIGRQ